MATRSGVYTMLTLIDPSTAGHASRAQLPTNELRCTSVTILYTMTKSKYNCLKGIAEVIAR